VTRVYHYRADVVTELARHGVRPAAHTSPHVVRGFVRDLYKYELVRLKERMLAGEFPKREYAARVDALRRQYPVLALLPEQMIEEARGSGAND
jgi:hypothetical protein